MLHQRQTAGLHLGKGLHPQLAAAMLGNKYPEIRQALERYRAEQTRKVLDQPDPSQPDNQEA